MCISFNLFGDQNQQQCKYYKKQMKKYDHANSGNKSLNLRYTAYRENSKDRNMKQIQPSAKLVNIFNPMVHANNFNLFRSPHQNYQRNQILQIEPKKKVPKQEIKQFQSDKQFLNSCKNGTLKIDFVPSTSTLQKVDNGETACKQVIDSIDMKMGGNIIRINESIRYRRIQHNFECNNLGQDALVIRGDFQSGNLSKYYQTKQNEYIIILNNDTNTHGYNQWFHLFFHLKQQNYGHHSNNSIYFIIANVAKQICFKDGMKLLTRKFKKQLRNYQDWQRNLPFQFFQSNFSRQNGQKCYSIGFSLRAADLHDGLFVALSFPYPFSRMEYLAEEMASVNSQFQAIKIGKSKLGNSIVVFRLFSESSHKNTKNVVILSRQHASQTSSSYICEFIIKRLTLFNSYGRLLSEINWHIIPMLNPDGVIHGNSRTNISGYDINRCWAHYLLGRSPEAQCVNSYLTKIGATHQDIFLDLHTHTRELGCFSYFNQVNQFYGAFNEKMAELTPSYDTAKCRVGYDSSKKNTFRAQMSNRFKAQNILTFEVSYYGYICPQTQQLHPYSAHDYQIMADGILKSIQHYVSSMSGSTFKELSNTQISTILSQVKPQTNIQSQSDTDPEGDYLNQEERKQLERDEKVNDEYKYPRPFHHNFLNIPEKNKQVAGILSNRNARSKINKQCMSQPKIVNIYEISNSISKYNSGSRTHQTERAISARLKTLQHHKNNQTQQSQQKNINTSNPINKLKYPTKSKCDQSYYTRQSFKSLFTSAQMRNLNIVSKKQINIDQDQVIQDVSLIKSTRKIILKQQKFNLQIKTNINNINFPLKTRNQQEQKLLKTLQVNVYKRKKGKSTRFIQGEKKGDNIYGNTINQKIAHLCELAKNIQKLTNFS